MPKKKPIAPKALPELVPVVLTRPGERMELTVRPEQITQLVQVVAACNRAIEAAERQAASAQPKRKPSIARFTRGLLLLVWMDHDGKGKLTKNLVNEIKNHCQDWPEVRDYKKHQSREKLRNALRNLAEDTRRALRDSRLPSDWRVPQPAHNCAGPFAK